MKSAVAIATLAACASGFAAGDGPIRTVPYDPTKVIHVPVARGVPTHVEFELGEQIVSDVAAGLASVCRSTSKSGMNAMVASDTQAPDAWDLCAPKNGRDMWVKPVGTGAFSNRVALRTNLRAYSFSFDVVDRPALAVQRLSIAGTAAPSSDDPAALLAQRTALAAAMEPKPEEIVEARLQALPTVRNSDYDVRTNEAGAEARPSAVFDDGRFTYFQFRGNRPLPAVFRKNADGSVQQVNPRVDARMGRLLVVDQVAPGWMLRLGGERNSPVAEVRNRAFDPEGLAAVDGSAAEGVRRVVRDPRSGGFKE